MTTALVLRVCREDMTSTKGFRWPGVGEWAEAPDWHPRQACGNGLHGWLHGNGEHDVVDYLNDKSKWLVVEVELRTVVALGGKVKFPRGLVRFIGDKKAATDYLLANDPLARSAEVIGAVVTVEIGRAHV